MRFDNASVGEPLAKVAVQFELLPTRMLEQQPDLLRRFRAGEREALARVYRFYFDDVYRIAQRSGVDRLDFVQDVFIKAFTEEARRAYDGLRPYKPFLLKIARNLRIDRARSASREPSTLALGDLDAIETREDLEAGLRFRLLEQTSAIVSALDEEVRAVARLRFVEDLSQLDVANRLGTTRRRVRTLEARLLRILKRSAPFKAWR